MSLGWRPGVPIDGIFSHGCGSSAWELTGNANCNAFTDAPQSDDGAAFRASERRINRAQQKDAGEPHLLERLAKDARLKCADVRGNVRQLRHSFQSAAWLGDCAMEFFVFGTSIVEIWLHFHPGDGLHAKQPQFLPRRRTFLSRIARSRF
jgi:hypothetical protein